MKYETRLRRIENRVGVNTEKIIVFIMQGSAYTSPEANRFLQLEQSEQSRVINMLARDREAIFIMILNEDGIKVRGEICHWEAVERLYSH
jgi:hypothetical protein